MIWINVCNISYVTAFSGIARTEYEVCLYAYQLYEKGFDIAFCEFNNQKGYCQITHDEIYQYLMNLKTGKIASKPKLAFYKKMIRSYYKRIAHLDAHLKKLPHCFNHNDTVITVGQTLETPALLCLKHIKKQISLKSHVLCHDIIPVNYPEFVLPKTTLLFSQYLKELVNTTDYFYCNSEFTKKELIQHYQKLSLTPPPMKVITLGSDLHTKDTDNHISDTMKTLTSEPYVIFVSTIEVRKNHQLIYDMYLQLLEKGAKNLPKVYFIGRRGWKVDDLLNKIDTNEAIKDKIQILDKVSDNDLITLYKHCWFTVYPSFVEGYGLPLAESLSFHKYCLSSNAGSLPEVGKDHIDYASPNDLQAWCEKFTFLINNPEYINQKELNLKNNYQPVSWQACAKEILDDAI